MDDDEQPRWDGDALEGHVPLPAIRTWRYARPTVVLGRAQRVDATMADRAARAGVTLRDRPSGGGAVLVGPWMLGVSVVLPADHHLVDRNIARSYGWFGEIFAGWLRAAGVDARLVAQPVAAGELRWACFAGLSHAEVVVDDRKLVGLAQARRRPGTLFAAGLLVARTPWELLCDVMGQPAEHAPLLAARTVSLAELPGAPDVDGAARALEARLAAAVGL